MKPVHCAAVDLGATSGRVIVGVWDGRRLTLEEVYWFPNQFRSLGGNDYWDLPTLWSEMRAGLVRAARDYSGLASVGVDTWGADYALVDSGGRLVFPAHAYRDPRTQAGLKRLADRGLQRVYAATGIPAIFYNTSLQLEETLLSNPGVRRLVDRCLFLPDYFNFLLSGRMENEILIASTSQLLGVRGHGWSRTALSRFGILRRWFTKPLRAGTRLGFVTSVPELKGVRVITAPGARPPVRIDRFAFYERARSAFAVVMTGETRKYGNILLKKGVTPCCGAAAGAAR